jgi:hypothetical protein
MQTDKSSLVAYVAQRMRAHGDGAAELALLDPLVRKAETGMYDLEPAARLRSDDAIDALAAATGVPIARASFVSLRDGGHPLVGDARTSFWDAYARGLTRNVKGVLWRRNMSDLHERLGQSAADELGERIWQTVGEPLWHSFEGNRWDETGQQLRLVVRANLLESLVQFCGYVMLGDETRLATLRPLIRLMASTMPVGERNDDPGNWVIITA